MEAGLLLVFFLFLKGFNVCRRDDANFNLWTSDAAFNDQAVIADQYSLADHQRVTSGTRTGCAATCLQLAWCQSFFFQAATQDCRLHADSFAMPVSTAPEPGLRYYKSREDACPAWRSYKQEASSGVCYKVHESEVLWMTSRQHCQAEGASLVTLDTPVKVLGVFTALSANVQYDLDWFHVGAWRPPSEWNSPWTSSSSFFVWEKTGESMMPVREYFYPDQPSQYSDENCIDFSATASDRVNATLVYALSDGACDYRCYFICEI